MGRYYKGDISGKFMLGVQSSDDASFFGVDPIEPNYIEYYFPKESLPEIKKGIKKCRVLLTNYEKKIDKFFKANSLYDDERLAKYLKIDKKELLIILKWYARLKLGEKILKCVEENEKCEFECEL